MTLTKNGLMVATESDIKVNAMRIMVYARPPHFQTMSTIGPISEEPVQTPAFDNEDMS